MFTGIIQEIGSIRRAGRSGGYLRLEVSYREEGGMLRPGDSMAVDGVCLTASRTGGGTFLADLSAETQRLTTLGALRPGDRVNLERPVSAADPLGGHIVLGHVDGVGKVRRVAPSSAGLRILVQSPPAVAGLLVEKGSVAVDGVSLTVGATGRDSFEVHLIPETQGRTTLASKRPGSSVNLEADYLAKLVRKFVSPDGGGTAGSRFRIGGEE